jgi:hypothetical protein
LIGGMDLMQVHSAMYPVVKMGEEYDGPDAEPLQLCYLQHAYRSGAHYNSCVRAVDETHDA